MFWDDIVGPVEADDERQITVADDWQLQRLARSSLLLVLLVTLTSEVHIYRCVQINSHLETPKDIATKSEVWHLRDTASDSDSDE